MLDFYISSGRFLGPVDERHVSLAVGPYYSHLYPVFESVAFKTGQLIDPYDVAYFEGEALDVLEEAFAAARESAQQLSDEFTVKVEKMVCVQVSKAPLVRLLEDLLSLIRAAKAAGKGVSCVGE